MRGFEPERPGAGWFEPLGAALVLLALGAAPRPQSGPGTVERIWKLSQTQGGRTPVLDPNDQLGRSVAVLGDLDENGSVDLATSGLGDDDGGTDKGAVYVLFLRADGRVVRHQKISALAGGFTGLLDPGDQLGRALCALGDLDGDGVPDLAAGASEDDDGGPNRGAVWILFLRPDGTVRLATKISQTAGGFAGLLRDHDEFGRSLARLGDLDGDGWLEVAVGAPVGGTAGIRRGVIWILSLRPDGTVARQLKVGTGLAGFDGALDELDWFGFSLATLGDLDGDGLPELAVGAGFDDDGAVNAGAVWLLYLRPDGTVKEHRKISMLSGGFTGLLEYPDQFGTSLATLGDLNGDGITELAVGSVRDDDGGSDRGAVYVLFLTAQGSVASHQKISALEGNLPPRTLDNTDWFGSSLAPLGDFDRDGVPDLVVGTRNDDDGGPNKGALYLTFLNGGSLALTASGSSPEASGRTASGAGARAGRVGLAWEVLGAGSEPDGSLELRIEEGLASSTLVFRMPVPRPLAGRGGLVRLFASPAPGAGPAAPEHAFPEHDGLLLERPALVEALEAVVEPGRDSVELSLRLPRRFQAALPLRFQALWLADGRRFSTDALEVRPSN